MLGTLLFKMIRFTIGLLLPKDKPPAEYTFDEVIDILRVRAAKPGEKLNWETSIVDLCKLLEFDPSFAARREMYVNCGGTGEYKGTEAQNTWLHEQVFIGLKRHGFGE